MKPENMIGKLVSIIDKESVWYKHWGYIVDWDGDVFHITGGSIATDDRPDVTPIFDRDQFSIPRNLKPYLKVGAKVDKDGRKLSQ